MRLDHLLFKKKEKQFSVQLKRYLSKVSVLSFPFLSDDGKYGSGELAQLARASALQAEGQGFEPLILHILSSLKKIEKETYTEKIRFEKVSLKERARVSLYSGLRKVSRRKGGK